MKVLVAGATGMVGGAVVRILAGNGVAVRGLVRPTSDPEKVRALRDAGAEIHEGDLRDAPSLRAACTGVDAVISTVSAMPFSWSESSTMGDIDRDGTIRLVDAAVAAGARRFVYVSFPHGPNPGFALGDAKNAAESYLRSSGLEYCVLAASFFMEVWLSPAFGFNYDGASATIYGDGNNACSWVSVLDVARSAAAAATEKDAANGVVPCGGPEALTALQVVEVFKTQSGRDWSVEHVPVETLQKQLQAANDEFQASVAMLQLAYATAPLAMDPKDYLVKSGLKKVAEYARDVLANPSRVR